MSYFTTTATLQDYLQVWLARLKKIEVRGLLHVLKLHQVGSAICHALTNMSGKMPGAYHTALNSNKIESVFTPVIIRRFAFFSKTLRRL